MSSLEDYAIFIYHDMPVVTRIYSNLYKFLVGIRKEYFIGSLKQCEELADTVVSLYIIAIQERV